MIHLLSLSEFVCIKCKKMGCCTVLLPSVDAVVHSHCHIGFSHIQIQQTGCFALALSELITCCVLRKIRVIRVITCLENLEMSGKI